MSSAESDLCHTAFNVEDTGDEFDLDIPPTSGNEYLRRVQLEAKQCPAIVVADIDVSRYKGQQTVKVHAGLGIIPPPYGYAPSKQWQKRVTADFSDMRQSLIHYKAREQRQENHQKPKLPEKTDVEGWCQLCFGRLQTSGLRSSTAEQSYDPPKCNDGEVKEQRADSSAVTDQDSILQVDSNIGVPPLLSIITAMDQPTVIQVLEYHVNWFEATGFTSEQGQWFYALLACLEKPLAPEACSLLRILARSSANLRASLDGPSDERLAALNLMICLVGRYFDQSDLADTG